MPDVHKPRATVPVGAVCPSLHHLGLLLRLVLVAPCQVPRDHWPRVTPAQQIIDMHVRLFDALKVQQEAVGVRRRSELGSIRRRGEKKGSSATHAAKFIEGDVHSIAAT